MSLQRTPPSGTRISGSESDLVPNLSTYGDADHVNFQPRKRKERAEVQECRNELANFRKDIMKFLEDFGRTQNENIKLVREEISEIKTEMKTIKSTAENFSKEIIKINSEIQNIKTANTHTEDKIKQIETEISQLKKQNTNIPLSKSPALINEDLVLELKERYDREKNIVIVGILEKNDKNYNIRQTYDNQEVFKLLKTVYEECPMPTKCVRLGKYIPNRNRPIKAYFTNNEVTICILRNRSKLPENIKLYSDQTPSQMRYLQSLKEELTTRKDNGEKDLIIKYVRGKPTITTISKIAPKNE